MTQPSSILILAMVCFVLFLAHPVLSIPLDQLDSSRQWKLERTEFFGNQVFSSDELKEAMVTKERPWYRFWQERPTFDPVTFETDLERLRRYYESRGYYDTEVGYDLLTDAEQSLVTVRLDFRERPPVRISEIDVEARGVGPNQRPPPLPDRLPIKRGDIFNEAEYQKAEQVLRTALLNSGYAHVKSERKAEVEVDERSAKIRYSIEPGPVARFGTTEIKGLEDVTPDIVSRELAYRTGQTYSLQKVVESREKLLALDLFGTVKVGPAEVTGAPVVVPMAVEVSEKPSREIKIGVGYGTEDEFRTQFEWRHLNWLGGGRRLSVLAKYSSIEVSGAVNFVQPHFLTPRTQGIVRLSHDQEDEETYLRNVTRLAPRLDHRFSPKLTGFVGYRAEYDKLNDVDAATVQSLGTVRREGFLSGPTVGLVWNTADDPFYPKKGEVVALTIDQAGAIWGGKYSFYKITAEAKKYIEIGWQTVFASRLKLGLGDAIGADENYPLFERFYSGGEKSVRGYGRRRLGPMTASDDPLGGLSLVEGSLELRRPIWKELHGALFVDFGQVSTQRFDPPVDNLQFAAGFGLSYATPVGPIRFDLGFPFKPPRGDKPWQVHFSIGAYF